MRRTVMMASFLVIIGFSLLIGGCALRAGDPPAPVYAPPPPESGPPPWAPAHGHRGKHHYYYYPASHLYFDLERRLYFYFSGGEWQASVSLPSGFQLSAGEYISLDMDTDRPYLYHSDIEKRYPPGQLKKNGNGKGQRKGKKWD